MRFVKASERKPEKKYLGQTIWRRIGDVQPVEIARYQKDDFGLFIRTGLGGEKGRIAWDKLEWLDEELPTSAEQEAETLYPYSPESNPFKKEYDREADLQRSAHINAARMYIGEIERLTKLVEAQVEYTNLLTDELNEVIGSAYVHGFRSTKVEKGEELRNKIAALKTNTP